MVYSVAILTWNDLRELLVVSRKEDPTKFCLPGGKIELNDYDDEYHRTHYYKHFSNLAPDLGTLQRAASRELKEETGIYARPSELYHVYTGKCGEFYECSTFWAPLKMLPEPVAVEPGTWVGWRTPGQLLESSPFADYDEALFEALNIRV